MVVNVVGLGYIGLPTALSMSAGGVEVIGTDRSERLLSTLRRGEMTFKEKGMDVLFAQVLTSDKLRLSATCQPADIYIIAVPTPYLEINKKIDASYVVKAVRDVMEVCPKGAILAVESTISPGTIERDVRPVLMEKGFTPGQDIHIAHVPERIIPGNMLYELEHNNRTIGVDEQAVGEQLAALYSRFCKGDMVITDVKTAEMTKVVENTFRDVNIAYANELAKICARDGMDVHEVIKIANMHPRVNILTPGPGVGGHCISVDPWFLIGEYPDLVNIIHAARKVNDGMPAYVLERVSALMQQVGIRDISRVGFYGLTYKENVDDTRESPTLQLIHHMEKHLAYGARFYDPFVTEPIVEGQEMDFDEFVAKCDIIVVMVAHNQIKENEAKLNGKTVLDTRHCLKSPAVRQL